jgi:uncharacterized metal-binding protein YceD (DUF177 family)
MTDHSMPPPLPFHRPVAVAALSRREETRVEVVPDAAESAALARFLDVVAVAEAALAGRLVPWGAQGWLLEAAVHARVEQACAVTLEPIHSVIETTVERRYLPGAALEPAPGDGEVEMKAGAEDAPEPLGAEIDLAAVLVEALSLAIDPYARAEGAAFGSRVVGPPGSEPMTDEAMRPFAKLAALKGRGGAG